MATFLESVQRMRLGRRPPATMSTVQKPVVERIQQVAAPAVTIAPNDPIIPYLLSAPNAVEVEKLHQLDSPAVRALLAAGVKLVIPLVSQGELVGVLNLGPRLSQQDYSTDDRRLLDNLATQAAPALRVAQLVREQQAEARARERLDQEMRVARLIQQTLLPRDLPALPGWQLAAYYQPARAVGGDFYDFLALDDGRLGLVIGDVTDKGVPAALVMATTRSILRSAAHSHAIAGSPGAVLERTNDLLHPDIPPKMFVTCLYAILDPVSGRLVYANAGHDLPFQRHTEERGVTELRARGMPLGLMPGMRYEEQEATLAPGESVLFYSDGLVEAHNPQREMFGFPHLAELLGHFDAESSLIDYLLQQLATFTGEDWEQEDDVTLVTLQRAAVSEDEEDDRHDLAGADGRSMVTNAAPASLLPSTFPSSMLLLAGGNDGRPEAVPTDDRRQDWRLLDEWTVPSAPGNERQAIARLTEAVREVPLSEQRIEDLQTAVGEATMNAMEHGNHYQPELPVTIQVLASSAQLAVRITDEGGHFELPDVQHLMPDLEAKLAGLQSPRGWGLFLIEHLVDAMHVTGDETHHTVELIISREGGHHASESI